MSTPFIKHLERMREIHERKSRDYSSSEDRFVNYHRQSVLVDWFDHPQDKVYAARLGEKLSRLATLRNKEYHAEQQGHDRPAAANEPIDDSFLDLCTISNIWWSDYEGGYRPVSSQPATGEGENSTGNQAAHQGVSPDKGSTLSHTERAAAHRDRGPAPERKGSPECPISFPRKSLVDLVEVIRMGYLSREELEWLIGVATKVHART